MRTAGWVAVISGALVLLGTVVAVGYFEWWGGDVDGIDRSFYVAGLAVGLVLVAIPLMRARRRRARSHG